MNCSLCKTEVVTTCPNCIEVVEALALDKEEVTLIRDMMVNEWIQRDHPYYHRAKEMFHKMHLFLDSEAKPK